MISRAVAKKFSNLRGQTIKVITSPNNYMGIYESRFSCAKDKFYIRGMVVQVRKIVTANVKNGRITTRVVSEKPFGYANYNLFLMHWFDNMINRVQLQGPEKAMDLLKYKMRKEFLRLIRTKGLLHSNIDEDFIINLPKVDDKDIHVLSPTRVNICGDTYILTPYSERDDSDDFLEVQEDVKTRFKSIDHDYWGNKWEIVDDAPKSTLDLRHDDEEELDLKGFVITDADEDDELFEI